LAQEGPSAPVRVPDGTLSVSEVTTVNISRAREIGFDRAGYARCEIAVFLFPFVFKIRDVYHTACEKTLCTHYRTTSKTGKRIFLIIKPPDTKIKGVYR
jgi:hypothetical protein